MARLPYPLMKEAGVAVLKAWCHTHIYCVLTPPPHTHTQHFSLSQVWKIGDDVAGYVRTVKLVQLERESNQVGHHGQSVGQIQPLINTAQKGQQRYYHIWAV